MDKRITSRQLYVQTVLPKTQFERGTGIILNSTGKFLSIIFLKLSQFFFQFPIDSSGILRLLKNNAWINAQVNLYCLWGNQVYPLEIGIGKNIKSPGNKPKKVLHFLNFDLDINKEEKKSIFEVSHTMAIKGQFFVFRDSLK